MATSAPRQLLSKAQALAQHALGNSPTNPSATPPSTSRTPPATPPSPRPSTLPAPSTPPPSSPSNPSPRAPLLAPPSRHSLPDAYAQQRIPEVQDEDEEEEEEGVGGDEEYEDEEGDEDEGEYDDEEDEDEDEEDGGDGGVVLDEGENLMHLDANAWDDTALVQLYDQHVRMYKVHPSAALITSSQRCPVRAVSTAADPACCCAVHRRLTVSRCRRSPSRPLL